LYIDCPPVDNFVFRPSTYRRLWLSIWSKSTSTIKWSIVCSS